MKHSVPRLAGVLVLLVLILAAFSGCGARSVTSTDTSDWKTVKQGSLQYSVPKSWKQTQATADIMGFSSDNAQLRVRTAEDLGTDLNAAVQDENVLTTMNQDVESVQNTEQSTVTIAGAPALRMDSTAVRNGKQGKYTAILFRVDGKSYALSYFVNEPVSFTDRRDFSAVVSTIHGTAKAQSSGELQSWQILSSVSEDATEEETSSNDADLTKNMNEELAAKISSNGVKTTVKANKVNVDVTLNNDYYIPAVVDQITRNAKAQNLELGTIKVHNEDGTIGWSSSDAEWSTGRFDNDGANYHVNMSLNQLYWHYGSTGQRLVR